VRCGRPLRLVVLGVAAVSLLALGHRDEIRARAAHALGSGMPTREAALARGFVLGEDDRIDPATVEDFRRAGLSHLLAVSGQNVALLALLIMPLLAALGMSLRARLVWILAAIAFYVPLVGGGPSIVRAGLMGALGVLATLAGRRGSRLHALVVAAAVTAAIDPGIAADVGWQLSFAAVLGILALARPLRTALARRVGARGWRGALAEGAAVTIAATLATAPLIAFHFEALSTTTLISNLLALPAIAPAMWLGTFVSIGAQVPGFPAAVPNAIAAPLLAYIAEVARWCGRPGWAYIEVRLGLAGLLASYLSLVAIGARLARVAAPASPRRPARREERGRSRAQRAAQGCAAPIGSECRRPACRSPAGRPGSGDAGRRLLGGSGERAARDRPRRRPGRRDSAPAVRSGPRPRRRWSAGRRVGRQAPRGGGRRARGRRRDARTVRPRRGHRRAAGTLRDRRAGLCTPRS
jgi:competence protein ComEC